MPFEGIVPKNLNKESITAEQVKAADAFTFRQMLTTHDDREGTSQADAFWSASQQPPEAFSLSLLEFITEESGMKQRALELIISSPEYEKYTEEQIAGATSMQDLAGRLEKVPGIIGGEGEVYSGAMLAEMLTHISKQFGKQFEYNTVDVAAAMEDPVWIDTVSYQGLLPPGELGLRGKCIELLEIDQEMLAIEREFAGMDK